MELFASNRDPGEVSAYVDMNRVFRRGELVTLCKTALAAEGELDTRELALRVMAAKGFDAGDNVLRKRIAYRIVQALSIALKRRTIGSVGKRNNVRVWRLLKGTPPTRSEARAPDNLVGVAVREQGYVGNQTDGRESLTVN